MNHPWFVEKLGNNEFMLGTVLAIGLGFSIGSFIWGITQ